MSLFSGDFLKERALMLEQFDNQRRNIGKTYHIASEIREGSKKGIAALKRGDMDMVMRVRDKLIELWDVLDKLEVPSDFAWQQDAEAGQELVEFLFTISFYDVICRQSNELDWGFVDPAENLRVTPQQWLAGIVDAATEVAKLYDDYVITHDLSPTDHCKLWEKLLRVLGEVVDYLDPFEEVYPQVVNNSRRKGFGNTFRGGFGRVKGFLERQRREYIIFRAQLKMNRIV